MQDDTAQTASICIEDFSPRNEACVSSVSGNCTTALARQDENRKLAKCVELPICAQSDSDHFSVTAYKRNYTETCDCHHHIDCVGSEKFERLRKEVDCHIDPPSSNRNESDILQSKITENVAHKATLVWSCSNIDHDYECLEKDLLKRSENFHVGNITESCPNELPEQEFKTITAEPTFDIVACEDSKNGAALAPSFTHHQSQDSLCLNCKPCDVIRSVDELKNVDDLSLSYSTVQQRIDKINSKHEGFIFPNKKPISDEQLEDLENNHILYCGDASSNASSYDRLDDSGDSVREGRQCRRSPDSVSPCWAWRKCRQRREYRFFILLAGFLLLGFMFSVQKLCGVLFHHTDGLEGDIHRGPFLSGLAANEGVLEQTGHPQSSRDVRDITAADLKARLRRSTKDSDFKCFDETTQKDMCGKGECENINKVKEWCNCPAGLDGKYCKNKCVNPSVEHFPKDPLHEYTNDGAFVVNLLIAIYVFCAIAQVCDNYFVPALEHICEQLELQADVAGATFMAAGSSAPELATSIIGVFFAQSDVGVGTIVGSSVFNLLFITAACGIFAGMTIELSWYPLSRDTIFYIISVGLLILFMHDANVSWWEALIMVSMYVVYVITMVFNTRLEKFFTTWVCKKKKTDSFSGARMSMMLARSKSRIACESDLGFMRSSMCNIRAVQDLPGAREILRQLDENNASKYKMGGEDRNANYDAKSNINLNTNMAESGQNNDESTRDSVPHHRIRYASELESVHTVIEEESERITVDEYENPLQFPKGWCARVYWIIVLPLTVLHFITIPDSRRLGFWRKLYPISFLISVIYIAGYSYIMVWMCTIVGHVFSIPETVTGLTILAAGTSVPDCLASVYVAMDGYGDMAVSNAIGSNVFDILLGLGIPWLVDGFIKLESKSEHETAIASDGIKYAACVLILTVVYLWVSLKINHWYLNVRYGIITMFVYVVVIGSCIFVEFYFLATETVCNHQRPTA